jgi:hypothetical protein
VELISTFPEAAKVQNTIVVVPTYIIREGGETTISEEG